MSNIGKVVLVFLTTTISGLLGYYVIGDEASVSAGYNPLYNSIAGALLGAFWGFCVGFGLIEGIRRVKSEE